jgi:5-epi-alpha-selinene synthase
LERRKQSRRGVPCNSGQPVVSRQLVKPHAARDLLQLMPNDTYPPPSASLGLALESSSLDQHPQLFCPFDPAINPAAARVQQSTTEWAAHFGLISSDRALRRFEHLQYGTLMARAYPSAPAEPLALIADWNTWLFLLDDQCDEQGLGRDPRALAHLHAQLLAILGGAAPGASAAGQLRALHDLATRLRAERDEAWMRHFVQCVADYCAANVWEAQNRAARQVPSEFHYRQMRPLTGGVFCYLALIELAQRVTLPRSLRDHPEMQRLASMTNNVICWSNDIISLAKELERGDVHNLVYIVHRGRGYTLADAVQYVADLHDAEVRAFVYHSAQAAAGGAEQAMAQRYIAGMRSWMRANLDWSAATARYRPTATS